MTTSPTLGSPPRRKEELRRWRRENPQLKLEREFLAKAVAWFAHKVAPLPEVYEFVNVHRARYPVSPCAGCWASPRRVLHVEEEGGCLSVPKGTENFWR